MLCKRDGGLRGKGMLALLKDRLLRWVLLSSAVRCLRLDTERRSGWCHLNRVAFLGQPHLRLLHWLNRRLARRRVMHHLRDFRRTRRVLL